MEASHDCSLQANLKSKYNEGLAKLYTAYKNPNLPITEYLDHLDNYSDSEIFKLNLYPVPFQHVGAELWKKYDLMKTTGLANKELYRIWCLVNRFPLFANLVEKHKPRLIIGTGVSHLSDFFASFASVVGLKSTIKTESLEPISKANKGTRNCFYAELNNGTMLAITPFLSGPSGLNSYDLIEKAGEFLREIAPPS